MELWFISFKVTMCLVSINTQSCDWEAFARNDLEQNHFQFYLYIYINGRTDVCLSVCLLVCGGPFEAQTPARILIKFCMRVLTCRRKVWVNFWPQPPPPPGPGGLETQKAEGHIFLQNKRCSAGCKLTPAALGTSASFVI